MDPGQKHRNHCKIEGNRSSSEARAPKLRTPRPEGESTEKSQEPDRGIPAPHPFFNPKRDRPPERLGHDRSRHLHRDLQRFLHRSPYSEKGYPLSESENGEGGGTTFYH